MYCAEVLKPGDSISPKIDLQKSEELLENLYSIENARIIELNGYDDKNFKVETGDGHYVLKILNSLDSKNVGFVEAQNELLRYLGEKGFVCPLPMVNVEGTYYSLINLEGSFHVVRLMEYIPGRILKEISPSFDLFYKIGKSLALMDKAMENFHHPGYENRTSLWVLEAVPSLRDFIHAVEHEDKRKRLEKVILEFEERVLPKVARFEKGLIHGDFNEQNIVVHRDEVGEWEMAGVLDFGDSHITYYLFELAIAMTYMMIIGENIESGGYVLAGYISVKEMSDEEISLLKVCIMGRLSQSLIMGAYSSLQDPENAYLLVTSVPGWNLFKVLEETSEVELVECWNGIVNKSNNV